MRLHSVAVLTLTASLLALGACSSVRTGVGLDRITPDEFLTVSTAPLTVPPEYPPTLHKQEIVASPRLTVPAGLCVLLPDTHLPIPATMPFLRPSSLPALPLGPQTPRPAAKCMRRQTLVTEGLHSKSFCVRLDLARIFVRERPTCPAERASRDH